MAQQLPQLEMELRSLDHLPEAVAPTGYRIRTYQEGDAPEWCRLINQAIGGGNTPESFHTRMAGAPWFDAAGLLFLETETEQELVGTACASCGGDLPEDAGYVHMVALLPERRGRGLGRFLVLSVLHRLRHRSCRRAVLRTDDFRLPAIRLYLSLGFRPVFTHQSHPERWRKVYRELGIAQALGS